MSARFRVVGLRFDHMHMGDNLRMVHEHPDAEIAGLFDPAPERMLADAERFGVPESLRFTSLADCLEAARPDLAIICSNTADHASVAGEVLAHGVHCLVEKPFAASLRDADLMIAAAERAGRVLAINWPLAWYPPHVTAKRILDEGGIGELRQVYYYDGNRGPLWHLADKAETTREFVEAEKPRSWWYKRASGGGSLLDYLGYGATLGTWFLGGRSPREVTCVVDEPQGLEVDENSITVARYDCGLCRFETRWGTFTDPWTHQPQPRCGFELNGTLGTLSCYDYEDSVRLQSEEHPEGVVIPVDRPESPLENPVQYVLDCISRGQPIEGPLSTSVARIGQQIVDTAVASASEKRSLALLD